MIGLVLITHFEIGTALRVAMEHVVGPQQQLMTLSIGADDDIQARRRDLDLAVASVDRGDGVVILTEWNEFKNIDLEQVRDAMRTPVILDGRNIYDPLEMRALGFTYRGVGRGFYGK